MVSNVSKEFIATIFKVKFSILVYMLRNLVGDYHRFRETQCLDLHGGSCFVS